MKSMVNTEHPDGSNKLKAAQAVETTAEEEEGSLKLRGFLTYASHHGHSSRKPHMTDLCENALLQIDRTKVNTVIGTSPLGKKHGDYNTFLLKRERPALKGTPWVRGESAQCS